MSEDFPRTLLELERRFSSEEACAEYLATLRWPGDGCNPPLRRNRFCLVGSAESVALRLLPV